MRLPCQVLDGDPKWITHAEVAWQTELLQSDQSWGVGLVLGVAVEKRAGWHAVETPVEWMWGTGTNSVCRASMLINLAFNALSLAQTSLLIQGIRSGNVRTMTFWKTSPVYSCECLCFCPETPVIWLAELRSSSKFLLIAEADLRHDLDPWSNTSQNKDTGLKIHVKVTFVTKPVLGKIHFCRYLHYDKTELARQHRQY